MRCGELSECLVGEHDFSSFRAADCDAPHPVRTIYQTDLGQRGELLVYQHRRHGIFAPYGAQHRRHAGRGGPWFRTAESFAELLDARDRTQAGYTAPPVGLYLVEVKYEPT